MSGETNLQQMIKSMRPLLNSGRYVFCSVPHDYVFDAKDVVCFFRKQEDVTLIMDQGVADRLQLSYNFLAAWITLSVHSSLAATGLTAAFSAALARNGISCNVVAAFYHDHIFVPQQDAARAMSVLEQLSENGLTKD